MLLEYPALADYGGLRFKNKPLLVSNFSLYFALNETLGLYLNSLNIMASEFLTVSAPCEASVNYL